MHHVDGLKKFPGAYPYWTCLHYGDIATYDFDDLTRLVFAAHEFCVRISIQNGGPRRLKIVVHDRKFRVSDSTPTRHPTIDTALANWRK